MKDYIELNVALSVAPEEIWELITEQRHLEAWFGPHVSLDARLGGAFREVWSQDGRQIVTSGQVEQFEPPRRIVWSWADDDWPVSTQLALELRKGPAGTSLQLYHAGWNASECPRGDELRDAHEAGWRHHLQNLERYASEFFSKQTGSQGEG
ncbi:MAG: SRPBCC family protein [Geminicoccaceae bacterium]